MSTSQLPTPKAGPANTSDLDDPGPLALERTISQSSTLLDAPSGSDESIYSISPKSTRTGPTIIVDSSDDDTLADKFTSDDKSQADSEDSEDDDGEGWAYNSFMSDGKTASKREKVEAFSFFREEGVTADDVEASIVQRHLDRLQVGNASYDELPDFAYVTQVSPSQPSKTWKETMGDLRGAYLDTSVTSDSNDAHPLIRTQVRVAADSLFRETTKELYTTMTASVTDLHDPGADSIISAATNKAKEYQVAFDKLVDTLEQQSEYLRNPSNLAHIHQESPQGKSKGRSSRTWSRSRSKISVDSTQISLTVSLMEAKIDQTVQRMEQVYEKLQRDIEAKGIDANITLDSVSEGVTLVDDTAADPDGTTPRPWTADPGIRSVRRVKPLALENLDSGSSRPPPLLSPMTWLGRLSRRGSLADKPEGE